MPLNDLLNVYEKLFNIYVRDAFSNHDDRESLVKFGWGMGIAYSLDLARALDNENDKEFEDIANKAYGFLHSDMMKTYAHME